MKSFTQSKSLAVFARVAIAAAAVAACGAASALPSFTFAPGAVNLAGTSFTADNLLVSDFATVTFNDTGFTEHGYLAVTGAQLGGTQVMTTGLGSTYGLYIEFNGAATTKINQAGFQGGNFDSLSYTLYGYNGAGTFTPSSAPMSSITLGSGTLVNGTFGSTATSAGIQSANANTTLTFATRAAADAFFVSPNPFYGMSQAAFTNTPSQIAMTADGFTVTQGGGSVNFVAAPVPEPETYALMLAGLGALGFVARRRNAKI